MDEAARRKLMLGAALLDEAKERAMDRNLEPASDVISYTAHAGQHNDWPIPWAGITVPRGTSVRLVRDAAGRWVEVRE